jgi:hypothetical protein
LRDLPTSLAHIIRQIVLTPADTILQKTSDDLADELKRQESFICQSSIVKSFLDTLIDSVCSGTARACIALCSWGMCICKFCSWYILYSGFWSLPASPFALPCGGFCASGARALFSFSFFCFFVFLYVLALEFWEEPCMSGCLQQNVRVVERCIHCRADSKTESVKCSCVCVLYVLCDARSCYADSLTNRCLSRLLLKSLF